MHFFKKLLISFFAFKNILSHPFKEKKTKIKLPLQNGSGVTITYRYTTYIKIFKAEVILK